MESKYMLLAIVSLVLIGLSACATNDKAAASATSVANVELETRVYEVFGMDCPGCHGGLEKLVKKVPAVRNAKASWEKKQLMVTVSKGSELDDDDILDAIKRSNLTYSKRLK